MGLLLLQGDASGGAEAIEFTAGPAIAMEAGTNAAGGSVSYFRREALPVASELSSISFWNAAAGGGSLTILMAVPTENGFEVVSHQTLTVSAGTGLKTFSVAGETLNALTVPAGAVIGFYTTTAGMMRYVDDTTRWGRYRSTGYSYLAGLAATPMAPTGLVYYHELMFSWTATATRGSAANVIDETFSGTTRPANAMHAGTAWTYGPRPANLFTNGTFDSDVAGWSSGTYFSGNDALAWNAGKARASRGAVGNGNLAVWQAITKPASGYVRITGDLTLVSGSLSSGTFDLRNYYSGAIESTGLTGTGSFDVVLQTNGTLGVIAIYGFGQSFSFDLDNLTCAACDEFGVLEDTSAAAIPGAVGITNRLWWQQTTNANKQTLAVAFEFTDASGVMVIGKEPCLGTASADYGTLIAAEIAANQLTIYNPYNAGGTLPSVRYNDALATLTLATGTPYLLELEIDGKTLTARITDVGTGDFDEFTHVETFGMGHGRPCMFARAGGVKVTRSTFTLGVVRPTFAIYGDSIVEGSGASAHANAFAELLIADAPAGFYSGDGGVTAVSCLKAMVYDLALVMPKYAILYAGANNANSDAETTNFLLDFADFVTRAAAMGATPIVMLPTPNSDGTKDARLDTMRAAVLANGCQVIRADLALGDPDGSTYNAGLMADAVHPNDAGHAALAARCLVDSPLAFGLAGLWYAWGIGQMAIGSNFIIG